ncbi:hypothetical protein FF1_041507 [Malus domestica]
MAMLAAIYSIFIVTLKYDLSLIRRTAQDSIKVGLVASFLPSVVTLSLLYLLGSAIHGFPNSPKGKYFKYFMTVFISFSFFPVIAQALDDLSLMTSELGQFAMSTAIVNDVIQWTLTTFYLIMMQQNISSHGVQGFLTFLALIIFAVYIIRPIILWIISNTPDGEEVKEVYVVAIQLGVLVMAFICDSLGATATMGAVILGLVIPEGPPLGTTLVHKTETLVSEFLLPMFFFRIGYSVDVYSISDWVSFSELQILITVSYFTKIVGITAAALWCKFGLKNSLMLSMAMSTKGIIETTLLNQWRNSKAIDDQTFLQIVLSMLGITMVVTPLLRFSYNPQIRLGASTKSFRLRSIQSMPRNSGKFCVLCCFHNEESVRNLITLLEASNPTEASPICAYVIHTVELMGGAIPRLVPHKKLSLKTPTHQMMRAFENYSQNSKGPVMIHAFNLIAPYKSMHETLFRLAHDKLIPLIIIPFHDHHGTADLSLTSAIRQFNINVQKYSQCTVGILVDRGSPCRVSLTHFSHNVAVFFIGGPDDRESLAYAERMLGNLDVQMTVLRIILRNKLKAGNQEERIEAKVDESLVEDFWLRNRGNNRLSWLDIDVEDSVQVMRSIKNMEGDYDLVMVGRRHAEISLRDEEMAEFVEHAELGVIGDRLASSDFCGGTVNVLVMQESRELGCGAFHRDWAKVLKKESSFIAIR